MRIVLVTGKGGVGKTTVSAATALRATDLGYRSLVISTDPAHSLGDAFDVPLGDEPRQIVHGLHAQQIDTQKRLESYWGEIRNQLMAIFDWGGVRGIEAEEFLVFPGMDELFALIEVRAQAISGRYDVVVVDCAPTAETLRLLSLPEVLSWYFDKMFFTQRRLMRAARPVLSRVTDLPLPGEAVYDAAENVFTSIEKARTLLLDTEVTSARLVVNPERMVVNEARRTYTYLTLFGYAVDGVVVNRVLPDVIDDPYFERWRQIQTEHLATIEDSFADVPVLRLRLFDDEMVGEQRLRELGHELYGDTDPVASYSGDRPFQVTETDGSVRLELSLPLAVGGDIDVMRDGHEVYVTVGPYRRSFVLPDSLQRREIGGARLSSGVLTIEFVER
jgi:arsenite/tail-anchored protein-transporting ATPase